MKPKRLVPLFLSLACTALLAVSCQKPGHGVDISPKTPKGPKAVFIGDSITWQWGTTPREISKDQIVIPLDPLPSFLTDKGSNVLVTWHPAFFTSNDYVDKGVSGETTQQMLDRFKKDVLDQKPQVVVIMGGTNDLAQGVSKDKILENISSMASQAADAKMKVVLCSITPCNQTYSRLSPHEKGTHIVALNKRIKEYAAQKGFTYCDYYPALADADGYSLKAAYCLYDRLHPNPDAYTVMEGIINPLVQSLLERN